MTSSAPIQIGHADASHPKAPPQDVSDLSEFLPFLEGYEMSPEAKLAFLRALYDLLGTIVDQALGEEPHQRLLTSHPGDAPPSLSA